MTASSQAEGSRVVVLRALGLGDLLVAVPALRGLANAYPAWRRTLVAPSSLAPLVRLLGPTVTDVVHADFRHRVGRVPAAGRGADVAVNLHGAGPQSHRSLLAAGARRLVAYRHRDVGVADGPEWREDDHEMVRWCRLLHAHGLPADPADYLLDVEPPAPDHPWHGATILHPGGASPARRWPYARWAELAARLRDGGHRLVITGSAAERPLALEIARRAVLDDRVVAAGRTTLPALARGLAGARRLVSGDTGVAHLATSVGTPSVLLFGPTPPARWGPPPDQDGRHVVLWAGRTGDPHGLTADPGLLEITVEDVEAAVAGARPAPALAPRRRS